MKGVKISIFHFKRELRQNESSYRKILLWKLQRIEKCAIYIWVFSVNFKIYKKNVQFYFNFFLALKSNDIFKINGKVVFLSWIKFYFLFWKIPIRFRNITFFRKKKRCYVWNEISLRKIDHKTPDRDNFFVSTSIFK